MKKSQIYSTLLLLWLVLLLLTSFSYAATPNYVGIEADDTFIYDVMYDEGVYEDFYEDSLEENDVPESLWDDLIDDNINIDEDTIGIKIVVLDVDDEEKDPWGEDGVRVIYNFYEKEEDDDWDLTEQDETWAIWDYDDDVYEWLWRFGFWWSDDNDGALQKLDSENAWFVSTKVKWDDIEEEIDDWFDDAHYDDFSIKTDKDNNRIEMSHDEDDDDEIEEWEEIIEYDNNGVLRYYEEIYDGETFVLVERQWNNYRRFIIDNMIWIIIGAGAILALIVVLVIVIHKRRK